MIAFRLLVVGIISSASILLTPFLITIAQTKLAPQEVSAIAKAITVRIVKYINTKTVADWDMGK